MIGVAAPDEALPWVAEFFELFKTPWEPAEPGTRYRVVLTADSLPGALSADIALVYGVDALPIDRGVSVERVDGPTDVEWNGDTFPLYRGATRFTGDVEAVTMRADGAPIGYRRLCGNTIVYRFGFGLFREVEFLLTDGQPMSRAATPTLELHIEAIRRCLRESRVPFVEVPPRPQGHAFVCCLTHDVDFFGVRRHAGDATLAGFIGRATAGTLVEVLRGRRRVDEAIRNWASVLSLPFVFLGLARDFWRPFEAYRRIEEGRSSTFFLIPFARRPGIGPNGTAPSLRGAPYGVDEIQKDIEEAAGPNTEFAVHGIDAWRDRAAGTAERRELAAVTGQDRLGVRMHWLYYSPESPRLLEEAGFAYDSTCGYNDAIGYRAGTAQVFKPAGARTLLELPLGIMDTALFYLDRMGLRRRQAIEKCLDIVQQVRRFGGALVVNWHDRSLAPERQWERPYQQLLREIDAAGAWYATAGQAVEWFSWRRAIRFGVDEASGRVTIAAPPLRNGLPPAAVVVHRAGDGTAHTDDRPFAGDVCSVSV